MQLIKASLFYTVLFFSLCFITLIDVDVCYHADLLQLIRGLSFRFFLLQSVLVNKVNLGPIKTPKNSHSMFVPPIPRIPYGPKS